MHEVYHFIASAGGCLTLSWDKVDVGYLLNEHVSARPFAAGCRPADLCPSARSSVEIYEEEPATNTFETEDPISTPSHTQQPKCILHTGAANPKEYTEWQNKLVYSADCAQDHEHWPVPTPTYIRLSFVTHITTEQEF